MQQYQQYLDRKSATFAILFCLLSVLIVSSSCRSDPKESTERLTEQPADSTLQHATFAMGCFWHSEEIFSEIKGVVHALPGYAGGAQKNPSYEEVSTGSTGYAESVDVAFDPSKISYAKLLEVFFAEHDPTTPDAQYPDEGPQYRSAIFFHSPEQKQEADAYIAKLTSEHKFSGPIVTQVAPYSTFYTAEQYHIHYYRLHPDQPYIAGVTRQEVEKFRKDFPELVR
jgi:peptide-methionine (S)-S-oxide reductase